jgi:hypothetical protein
MSGDRAAGTRPPGPPAVANDEFADARQLGDARLAGRPPTSHINAIAASMLI